MGTNLPFLNRAQSGRYLCNIGHSTGNVHASGDGQGWPIAVWQLTGGGAGKLTLLAPGAAAGTDPRQSHDARRLNPKAVIP